jgi:hypothetical protein
MEELHKSQEIEIWTGGFGFSWVSVKTNNEYAEKFYEGVVLAWELYGGQDSQLFKVMTDSQRNKYFANLLNTGVHNLSKEYMLKYREDMLRGMLKNGDPKEIEKLIKAQMKGGFDDDDVKRCGCEYARERFKESTNVFSKKLQEFIDESITFPDLKEL